MDSYPIYLNKPWTNRSRDAFSGWSITVSASAGALVVGALAILVSLAGECTWGIVAFAMHQIRASNQPETGFFRQTQVLLRNSGSSLGTGIYLLRAGWKWHGVVDGALLKYIGLAALPICPFGSFLPLES